MSSPKPRMNQAAQPEQEQDQLFGAQSKERFPVLVNFLDSGPFSIFVTLITFYALFGDDVRVAAFNRSADFTFDILNIITLSVFTIEIIISVIARREYFNTFFFWLDVISTISLILDIQLITNAMGLTSNAATNTASLARAGRASRVGTKAGRVVRLVRLIRIVKLYKTATTSKAKQGDPNDQDYDNLQESKVSKRLSDLTTKRVIIIVLSLLLIMPLFDTGYYYNPPVSMDFMLMNIRNIAESSDDIQLVKWGYNQSLEIHADSGTPVAMIYVPFTYTPKYQSNNFFDLRDDELQPSVWSLNVTAYMEAHKNDNSAENIETVAHLKKLQKEDSLELAYVGALSLKWTNMKTSYFSIAKTIFVCMVLTIGALMFSKDANDLALRPIERMIEKVKKIAKNPKKAIEEKLIKDEATQNETVLIENAIIKIGTLLALGFGDAGSEIIAQNMSKHGDVDPMLPGKKKCAIYGFCDIRNFTDATEVLQEDVMLFVNNIGELVHTVCDRYQGSANKNIGDAFLLVWTLTQGKYTINKDNSVQYHDERHVQMQADCALLTFMKVWAKINREPKILKYREDERLQKRLKNYKVKLGLGLHIGWGIEGAIGSEFKIDASYLSPSVNMAARLEGSTKAFGVPLLISGDLYQRFSPGVQKQIRQVDYVLMKGTFTPMGLYTIDMDVEKLPVCIGRENDAKKKKQDIAELIEKNAFFGEEFLKKRKDFRLILRQWNPIFQDQFQQALKVYLSGDWVTAKKKFDEVIKIAPNDGPAKAIYYFMEEYQFVVPQDWPHYRQFSE